MLYATIVSLLVCVLAAWFSGLLFDVLNRKESRSACVAGLSGITVIIIVFCMGKTVSGFLAIGLSYYSLMLIGYIISVMNLESKAIKNPVKLLLAAAFLPVLIEGPICDANELADKIWSRKRDIRFSESVMPAFARFSFGLFKKLVIADRIAPVSSALTATVNFEDPMYIVGILLYSVRLIADFTGGIDMAIAVSSFFGVKIPENFRHPLHAISLSDFWSRWHITLSGWFRKYVFYPVSVELAENDRVQKLPEGVRKRLPVYSAALLTWTLTGFWHSFSLWHLFWGLSNALILLISYELKPIYKEFHKRFSFSNKNAYRLFMMARTFLITAFLRWFDIMAANRPSLKVSSPESPVMTVPEIIVLISSIAFCFAVSFYTAAKRERYTDFYCIIKKKQTGLQLFIILLLNIVTIVFGAYGKGYDMTGFIYGNWGQAPFDRCMIF